MNGKTVIKKHDILKKYFGHDDFRDGQEEIIDSILSGRDVLGIMPTGSGKSICYQVPAMMADGVTLVISPLISLMKDQVGALVQAGVPAAFINSSLTYAEHLEVFRRAGSGEYKIIYAAPERLVTDGFIAFAERTKISMVTVDEAHCVSQWGQDFRPSYLKISEFIGRLSYRPVVSAFTATATEAVKKDIVNMLELKDPFVMMTGFDRPNLYFEVRRPGKRLDELVNILRENAGRCCIVYCSTRKNVETVCSELNDKGFSATRYHAGLSDRERRENQDDFLYDRKNIMVATNAFGMGIDKSDVSLVVHYNMPKNIESYYQEAGRAGRDGEPALCILLYNGQDVVTNRFLIENSGEYNEEIDENLRRELIKKDMERLRSMTFYCATADCLRGTILRYFGENAPDGCGYCSNCLTSYEVTDITVDAQKIVSCVYRLLNRGRRSVGKTTLADIMHGSKSEKITKMEYNTLTTYGIMSDRSLKYIRGVIDQLIAKGYLAVTEGEYPVVVTTKTTAKIIKEDIRLEMKLPKEKKAVRDKAAEYGAPADPELMAKLKELRKKLAARKGVPAYIIFTDSSLHDMCVRKPSNEEEFLAVSGVGRQKCELYGSEFLEVINNYTQDWTKEADNMLRECYNSGLSLTEISGRMERPADDIRIRLKKLGLVK